MEVGNTPKNLKQGGFLKRARVVPAPMFHNYIVYRLNGEKLTPTKYFCRTFIRQHKTCPGKIVLLIRLLKGLKKTL